jgi:hypothetical protein
LVGVLSDWQVPHRRQLADVEHLHACAFGAMELDSDYFRAFFLMDKSYRKGIH